MTTTETTNIRLRLTQGEITDLETVRAFLGLKSVSATAARLVTWNAHTLAESLRADGEPQAMASTLAEVASDAVRLSFRHALLQQFAGGVK